MKKKKEKLINKEFCIVFFLVLFLVVCFVQEMQENMLEKIKKLLKGKRNETLVVESPLNYRTFVCFFSEIKEYIV